MVAELLTPGDVRTRVITALGFDPTSRSLLETPVLGALILRAASFQSPCKVGELARTVAITLKGLEPDDDLVDRIEDTIDALVSYGDLHELPAQDGQGSALYLGQPAFIERATGACFLVGVAGDGEQLLPASFSQRVRYNGCARSLKAAPGEDLTSVLKSFGLQQVQEKLWFKKPKTCSAKELVNRYDELLDRASSSGTVENIEILDSSRSVRFYKGRWRAPGRVSGRFVARRPQRFGAALWCYAELLNGDAVKLIDINGDEWRACDHAWRLQMALDALRDRPQVVEVCESVEFTELRFFSPLPSWVRKRWDIIGEPVESKGALLAYTFSGAEFSEEEKILTNDLWLAKVKISMDRRNS